MMRTELEKKHIVHNFGCLLRKKDHFLIAAFLMSLLPFCFIFKNRKTKSKQTVHHKMVLYRNRPQGCGESTPERGSKQVHETRINKARATEKAHPNVREPPTAWTWPTKSQAVPQTGRQPTTAHLIDMIGKYFSISSWKQKKLFQLNTGPPLHLHPGSFFFKCCVLGTNVT